MKSMSVPHGVGATKEVHEETLPHLWRAAVASHGDRPAVADADGRLNFLELDDLVMRVAHSLALRAPQGARVLIALPNGRDFCAVLLGALAAGLTVVPSTPGVTAYQLDWLLEDADPVVVVTSASRRADVTGRVTVIPDELYDTSGSFTAAGRSPAPDETALLLYTSGSSSRPKGIVCPHRAVVWAARAIDSVLDYRDDDVVYVRVPMSFDYGLYQLFLCALSGACLAFPTGELSAKELRQVIASGATVVPVVPSLAELLTRLARRDGEPSSVRLFTNTGEALVSVTAANLRAAFPAASLVCMYGMSECKRITIAYPDEDVAHPGTVGHPLPGTRVCVVDEDGRLLPPETVGQIRVAGPHVMAGYHSASALEESRFVPSNDGARRDLLTGDYGWMDEQGRLYFVGRRDDIFKRHGLRMSVTEIEEAVAGVPGVRSAASRCPDPDGTLTVWVVTDLDEPTLRERVVERLSAQRAPDRFVILARLPTTPHGKVDRLALPECQP